ncbi:hypothetical protein IWZ01DRAFT_283903 [Phyllosticta capitalensis]
MRAFLHGDNPFFFFFFPPRRSSAVSPSPHTVPEPPSLSPYTSVNMSGDTPQTYKGVLLGIGPFLRRRSSTSVPGTPQAPSRNRTALPLEANPTEKERIYAGHAESYRSISESFRLLHSFSRELTQGLDDALSQQDEEQDDMPAAGTHQPVFMRTTTSTHGRIQASGTQAIQATTQISGARQMPADNGTRKDYEECTRDEKRKRDKALGEICFYWELDEYPAGYKLSVLEELRPTEAMHYQGKGTHNKPTLDEFFEGKFLEKPDHDCGGYFLTQLSWFAQLYCGDRRQRGLDLLRHVANVRQIPGSTHQLKDIMELICDDISKALGSASVEKLLLHPAHKTAIRLQDIGTSVAAIEENIATFLEEQGMSEDAHSSTNKSRGRDKNMDRLQSLISAQKRVLQSLVESVNGKLAVQRRRLPPREVPDLLLDHEMSVTISSYRPGEPLQYEVEFAGREFTYEDIMVDEIAPTVRVPRLKFQLRRLKKSLRRQQRLVDMHMQNIHKRALRYLPGRIVSNKIVSDAINEYIWTHDVQAERLHQAMLELARLKAAKGVLKFHIKAQTAPFLERAGWRGFKRLDPGLEAHGQ